MNIQNIIECDCRTKNKDILRSYLYSNEISDYMFGFQDTLDEIFLEEHESEFVISR